MKIVFVDIDGTLTYNRHNDITKPNVKALKWLQQKEIYVVLATGRGLKSALEAHKQIKFNNFSRYIICTNGAQIFDTVTNEYLVNNQMGDQEFKGLAESVIKHRLSLKPATNKEVYTNNIFLWPVLKHLGFKWNWRKNVVNIKKPNLPKLAIWKLTVNKTKINLLTKQLRQENPDIEFITSGGGLLIEATKHGVSKATAAEYLLDQLGLVFGQAIHIGDSMNDYELGKRVDAFYVIDGCEPELLRVAKARIQKPLDSGIAILIRNLFTKRYNK